MKTRLPILLTLSLAVALAGAACSNGSKDPCAEVNCGDHGFCEAVAGAPSCRCESGYVEDELFCITDPCGTSPCVYGTCTASGKNAICDCYPGYSGARCDACAPGYRLEGMACVEGSACEEDPCVYGHCRSVDGLPVCDCYLGYAGTLCDGCAEGYHAVDLMCVSDTPCDPDPCVHGHCSEQGGLPHCACDPGYEGSYCDACAPGYHEEGLQCVPDVGGPCDPNPCQEANRHICQPDGDAYQCLCDPGWHDEGGACVADTACNPNPCTDPNRGVCSEDGAGGYTCACDPGYHLQGNSCVADTACNPNPCEQAHQTVCQEDGQGGYTCACDPGWHDEGGACVEDTVCDPATTCSGHGSCTGNGLECACEQEYDGAHCEGCADGYHDEGGLCVASSVCNPNPCDLPHRGVCVDQDGQPVCLCDPGYYEEGGSCVSVCDTVVRYQPSGGESITALYIRGEFNGWGLGNPFSLQADGSYKAVLTLSPGDYAYKLYEQGGDRWFEDPGNPFFKWESGTRNSRLHVRDCDRPRLQLAGQPQVGAASVSFSVQYVDGAQGAGVDPASVAVSHNRQAVSGAFDAGTGVFTISASGLAQGKHTWRFSASDNGGRKAELLYVPVWLESSAFAWEDAVLYFAMTDRFVDGNAANNAPVGGAVDYRADWQGGDFAGLKAKIDAGYFDDLGVNAIWISSISQNTAGAGIGLGSDTHMYSAYHSYWPISTGWRDDNPLAGVQPVDPHFGTLAEFNALVDAAHARGIRVLVDFVANHVHEDSPLAGTPGWFHDLYICGWDQPINCWFAAYLPDFEYKNLDVMNTVVEHAIWLIQETDIDGFRLDAVKHMIHDFSYTLRGRIEQSVTTTGLRFYMVGETFTGEGQGEASLIREYVRPEELDGQFDFPLFWQVVATFLREERDFYSMENMLQEFEGFYGSWAVMSNFLGNHDVCRAVSHAAGDIADLWGNGSKEQGWNNPPSDPTWAEPYQRLRLAWTFLLTVPGIPLVYYGDEFGLAGAGDPDNRRMMKADGQLGAEQLATRAHFAAVAAARHAHRAFRYGTRSQLFNDGLFWAYAMVEGSDRAVVVFNRNAGSETRSVPVASAGFTDGTVLYDVVHGGTASVSGGQLSVTLGGRDSAVFVLQ